MLNKRLEGRDEEILDPRIPIIDAHHHLHVYDRPVVSYMMDEFLEDAGAGHNVVASVYVELSSMFRQDGPEHLKPLGEVEFANGVAAASASGRYGKCRVAAAIVGNADLRHGARVGELLDRCMNAAPDRFRGIRQVTLEHTDDSYDRYLTNPPPKRVMQSPGFREGFRELAARGLTFDAAVFHHQLDAICALAGDFGETTIVLNHMGLAMAMELSAADRVGVFLDWKKRLGQVAKFPNVVCKVGGLGMPSWGFGFEVEPRVLGYRDLASAWQPYVETAIELFGASRCLMESNYPADARSAGYVPLWNALKYIVRSCTDAEKADLFHGTAGRVYRIDLESLSP
ncbi:amidohydrolase family protein [Variovorax paradoxus]|nr:amidohydrolase family protein [Variovorax paradoxus]